MMRAIRIITMACIIPLFIVGCATSPEAENRRQAIQADIDAVLSVQLDPAEYGETKRCLREHEYRNFQALDEQHILFEGKRDKFWINTLRSRCPDLRFGSVIRMQSLSGRRICDMDTFQVGDWFDWPWYRRWPWRWTSTWGTGMQCSLGKFQPVTEDQVAEIKALLKSR